MPNPYYIHPYVVKDLAHCVNLGQAFLRRNSIDLRYREAGVEVSHKGHSASLTSYNKSQYLGAVVNSVQLTLTQNSKVCFIWFICASRCLLQARWPHNHHGFEPRRERVQALCKCSRRVDKWKQWRIRPKYNWTIRSPNCYPRPSWRRDGILLKNPKIAKFATGPGKNSAAKPLPRRRFVPPNRRLDQSWSHQDKHVSLGVRPCSSKEKRVG